MNEWTDTSLRYSTATEETRDWALENEDGLNKTQL